MIPAIDAILSAARTGEEDVAAVTPLLPATAV